MGVSGVIVMAMRLHSAIAYAFKVHPVTRFPQSSLQPSFPDNRFMEGA